MRTLRSRTTRAAIVLCLASLACRQVELQPVADLSIENVSLHTTLPQPSGQQRVGISFRVVNNGRGVARASVTRVRLGGSSADLRTPELQPRAAAFVSHNLTTADSQLDVALQADALNAVSESHDERREGLG